MMFRSTIVLFIGQCVFSTSVVAADLANSAWKSVCQSSSSQDHSNLTASFTDKDFYLTTNNFDKSDCAGASLAELKLTGVYAAVDQKIDFTYATAMFTPHDGRVVFYLNLKRAFGYGDWKANVAKNVAGRAVDSQSAPVPAVGTKTYDIYKLDLTKLFFGKPDDGHDGSTAGNRPVAYDMAKPFLAVTANLE